MNRVIFSFFQIQPILQFKFLLPLGISILLFINNPILSNENTSTEPNPNHPNYEQMELKYEEGEVTINLKLAAENLKRKAEKNYSQMVILLKTRGKEDDLIPLRTKMAKGNTEYLRRNYKIARRIYKDLIQQIESIAENLNQDFRNHYTNYTELLNNEILFWKEKRGEQGINPFLLPYLERKGNDASEYNKYAEWLTQSQGNLPATNYYKLSIMNLLDGIIRSRQEKERKPIPEDHLSEEEKKIYDESRNLVYEEESKKREEYKKWLEERKPAQTQTNPTNSNPENSP